MNSILVFIKKFFGIKNEIYSNCKINHRNIIVKLGRKEKYEAIGQKSKYILQVLIFNWLLQTVFFDSYFLSTLLDFLAYRVRRENLYTPILYIV